MVSAGLKPAAGAQGWCPVWSHLPFPVEDKWEVQTECPASFTPFVMTNRLSVRAVLALGFLTLRESGTDGTSASSSPESLRHALVWSQMGSSLLESLGSLHDLRSNLPCEQNLYIYIFKYITKQSNIRGRNGHVVHNVYRCVQNAHEASICWRKKTEEVSPGAVHPKLSHSWPRWRGFYEEHSMVPGCLAKARASALGTPCVIFSTHLETHAVGKLSKSQ